MSSPPADGIRESLNQLVNYAPLLAALLAPACTLYDIPGLSEKWYTLDGVDQPDPKASLILSAFSLAASVIANVLLVFRFSIRWTRAWRMATRLSTVWWGIKTAIGIANLITFGALTRNGPGYAYAQGFWCAVLSLILSGIITLLLASHYTFHFTSTPDSKIRFQGRALITSELLLFALIAINALIFSRIEKWSYLDALYFSVVSILSIGFGDFSPTQVSTKILLFFYIISGIALLANQISIIVDAISSRSRARRLKWKERYAKEICDHDERHAAQVASSSNDLSDMDALQQEVHRLRRAAEVEENLGEIAELIYSLCALVTFWLLGAVIYHFAEGWSFGDCLYFNYIFLFTIGYGDFSPSSPAGRSVFVIWALLAVPLMTNFVAQTIQTLVQHGARLMAMATSQKKEETRKIEEEFFEPHSSYLDEALRKLNGEVNEDDDQSSGKQQAEEIEAEATQSEKVEVSKDLLLDLLSTTCFLEAQAREMLIDKLDKSEHSRILLEADKNLQLYTLDRLNATRKITWMDEWRKTMIDADDLHRVKSYRKTYARLLVMGTKLLGAEGNQLLALQRRRPSGSSLSSGPSSNEAEERTASSGDLEKQA